MDKMSITWTLIAQLLMFLTALAILSRFLFKPMLAVFEKRRQLTEGPKEQADKLGAQAQTDKKSVEEGLAAARGEAEKLREALLNTAHSSEREIVGEARAKGSTVAEAARQELAGAVSRAQQRLAADANDLAELLTSKMLEL